MTCVLLVVLLLQPDPRVRLADGIEKADDKAVREALAAVLTKDDAVSARAMIAGLAKMRERARFYDRALADTQKTLARYEAMHVLTPADRKERDDGVESSRNRINTIVNHLKDLEEIHDALSLAFRSLKSDAAMAAVHEECERNPYWRTRCEMAEAMASMSQADGEKRLRDRLSREKEPAVIATIVEALGARMAWDEGSLDAIAGQLRHASWPVVIAAARSLAATGSPKGVEHLVEAIQGSEGRIKNELNASLKLLTKTDMYGDPAAWAAWWKTNKDDFLAGTYDPKSPKRPAGGMTTFYEVPVISRRVCFVIDRSGSMKEIPDGTKERKSDTVRREMKALLAALPDGTRVNIVLFGDRIDCLAQSTRKLDAMGREDAVYFLEKNKPVGKTNLWDGLDKALSLVGSDELGSFREDGVDTIFVLSDGEPTTGLFTNSELIIKRVTRENRFLRAAIHTIAVGDVGTLLSRLAELNDGSSTQK